MGAKRYLAAGLTIACLALPAPPTAAMDGTGMPELAHSGLMLFPALTSFSASGAVPRLAENRIRPELDIFYSKDHERLRFLAEAFLRSGEQEVERFQVGWLASDATTLWVGRFHAPWGLWNTSHHHGAFMQTSIQRPGVVAIEDEGGILPAHVTGVNLEGTTDVGQGSVNYSAVIGRGPSLREDELQPVKINTPSRGGKQSAIVRLGYRSQPLEGSELGAFGGRTVIPVKEDALYNEVTQTVGGVYYHWDKDRFQLLGELFHFSNRVNGATAASRSSFNAGYLQMEYRVRPQWIAYGRLEDTRHNADDSFLNLLPDYIHTRAILGARYALSSNQALKLELSRNERLDQQRYNLINLQWSMVYP